MANFPFVMYLAHQSLLQSFCQILWFKTVKNQSDTLYLSVRLIVIMISFVSIDVAHQALHYAATESN